VFGLGCTALEKRHHAVDLRLNHLKAATSGVAEGLDVEELHVSQHGVQGRAQIMSNGGEIHMSPRFSALLAIVVNAQGISY
jgi:hypothetical protein